MINVGDTPKTEETCRTFLCIVDDSEELSRALRFACNRANHTGGRVALLYVAEPAEFQHWMAVGERMREEARAEAEEMMQAVGASVQRLTGKIPSVFIREGKVSEELIGLLNEYEDISLLVLGAATGPEGPGPLVEAFVSKMSGNLRVPVTLVPGNLTDEQIDAIT